MNGCREIQTTSATLQSLRGHFQLLPQNCPAALHLGFKVIVRHAHYHPMFPFHVYERGVPLKDEGEATRFHQQKVEDEYNNMSKITEQSHERYVNNMVSEGDQQNSTARQFTMHV
jgi:hypothetical protein